MKRFFYILALLGASLSAGAQSIQLNPKPGQVSDSEVALSVYYPDTTASAVYLVDRQDVAIRTSDVLELRQYMNIYQRIKVLKEAGKDLTDYKIVFPDGDNINGIKVTTYNAVDGKVVKTKLDRKYIFKEKVDDNTFSVSFSAPEVRVGSVVEVSFELMSKRYWDIPELVLQHSHPTNMVTVSMEHPDFISLNKMSRGYLTPVYEESETPRTLHNNVMPTCQIIGETFSLTDVPAIPREVSSMYPDQYRCAVSYEVSGVAVPGVVYRQYSVKWPDVDKSVRETAIISQCAVKGKILEPFVSTEADGKKAIAQVRCAVLDAVKWDNTFTLIPDNVRDVLKERSGSSASINAIVASVLNSMGYKVSPVLLRKRSKGMLASFYVRTDAFTSMILKVETPSGAVHYLDAAPDYGYIDVLNPDFLVDDARVYPLDGKTPASWEKLSSRAASISIFAVDAHLQEDGRVKGTIGLKAMGESSYLLRQTHDALGSDEKYFELVEKGEAYETLSYEYRAAPYDNALEFTVEFEQNPVKGGEFLYVKPFLVTQYHKSDFPPGERYTPVDFPVLDNMTYRYNLHLPEGWEVEQLPPMASIRSTGFKALASCRSAVNPDGSVSLSFSFKNSSLQVPANNYQDLRAFWEQLCNLLDGTIVLKKK